MVIKLFSFYLTDPELTSAKLYQRRAKESGDVYLFAGNINFQIIWTRYVMVFGTFGEKLINE